MNRHKVKKKVPILVGGILLFFAISPLPVEIRPDIAFEGPSMNYLFGTSPLGESILSLLLNGTAGTFLIAVCGRSIALTLSTLGLFLSFLYGKTLWIFEKVSEAAIAIPSLLLALSFSVLLGQGVLTMLLAIGLSEWAFNQRWLLSRLRDYRQKQFMAASEVMGSGKFLRFRLHILPELKQDLPFLFKVYLPGSILTVATLEFLGISKGGLGFMVASYRDYIFSYPHVILPPTITVIFLVLMNISRDSLNQEHAKLKE
jgi:ABC-type dipeptide/oligopeptide/nickel transport system permease subunit